MKSAMLHAHLAVLFVDFIDNLVNTVDWAVSLVNHFSNIQVHTFSYTHKVNYIQLHHVISSVVCTSINMYWGGGLGT